MLKQLLFASLIASCQEALAVMTVNFTVWNETCGNANGAIEALVSGGVSPYSYSWSSGGTDLIEQGLAPGWHVLTVTDAMSQVLVDSAEVLAVPDLEWPGFYLPVSQAGLFGCNNGNAGFHLPEDPMNIGWYNVSGFANFSPMPFDVFGSGYLFGPYTAFDYPQITITDNTGCTGTVTIMQLYVSLGGSPQLLSVQGACLGANGSFSVDPWGGGYSIDEWTTDLYDDTWNLLQSCQVGFCGSPAIDYTGLAAGDYHVVRYENFYDPYGMSCPPETLDVTVPDLGPSCGQVTGTLFLDHDQDCTQDANDEPIPFRVMTITPGPEYAITGSNGQFSHNLGYGSYDLDQQPGSGLLQLCPTSAPIPFTLSSLSPVVNLNIADSSLIPLDLSVTSANGPYRLGFDVTHAVNVHNASGQVSGPVTLSFTYDAVLTLVSTSPVPTSTAGNTLTWTLPALGAFANASVQVVLNVPPVPGLLGTVVNNAIAASNTITEADLSNNVVAQSGVIVGAYDPNDKAVRTSSGISNSQYFIGTDEWLEYTIRFQNTGTDTAFTVVVVDTLPTELDPLTFVPGAASHMYDVSMAGAGIVSFTFPNILLPDSNVNETASHGFVSFRILPHQPVLPGTMISNATDIYFDFNPPIHTNDAVVVAELSTGQVEEQGRDQQRVWPNPTHDMIVLQGAMTANSSIAILGADGRLIMRPSVDARTGAMDVHGLSPGMYVLSVTDAIGVRSQFRFIKNR